MKKRLLFLLIIPLSLLILAGGGLGIFRYATQGKLYTADGLRQNDRCYMQDVYYENGVVHYTVVNRTPHSVAYGYCPSVQKWVDDKWQPHSLLDEVRQRGTLIRPYSGANHHSFQIDVSGDELIGKYRLIIMSDRFAVVGYFSVEADA